MSAFQKAPAVPKASSSQSDHFNTSLHAKTLRQQFMVGRCRPQIHLFQVSQNIVVMHGTT
jgi:hypothetical protein